MEFPYPCDYCGARFATQDLLDEHTEGHEYAEPVRTYYTTAQVRASDLRDSDTFLDRSGKWREIFDVWKDEDLYKAREQFGEDSEYGRVIIEKLDVVSPLWVVVRYLVPETSTAGELEDALVVYFLKELVTIQVPAKL